MSCILFIDPVCPKPYTFETLENDVLGGTEATVLRVAKGLAGLGHQIVIEQRGRTDSDYHAFDKGGSISYIAPDVAKDWGIHFNAIITLRDAGVYSKSIQLYSKSVHYIWMHDVVSGEYRDHMLHHLRGKPTPKLIVVSDFHKKNIEEALYPDVFAEIKVIYNPVDNENVSKRKDYDPYALMFMSSPHKGLEQVLGLFEELKRNDDRYTLYVANPGYYADFKSQVPGVVFLGKTSHKALLERLAGCLCLFYPQNVFEETFGLVLAESNAVGVPVLCAPIGAAPEVIEHPKQLVFGFEDVIPRVLEWSSGSRPLVKAKKEFMISRVISEWIKLL